MAGNQTMDYYIRPRHLYSHSRTCTCSILCRRLSILVAFLICYLLDRASVHEISALVTWFQCLSDIFSFHGDLGHLYIFIMEILIYLYCMWWWPHMSYIMPMHGHCTLMYTGLLYVLVVICRDICTILLDGWFFITPLLGWTYNVFHPSYHPSDLTH